MANGAGSPRMPRVLKMAKMIPPYCDDDAPGSEKRVFRRLREDPDTTEWTVLHSLGLARRQSSPYGEIDFVAIIPREGIVCLEVKGGRVSCRDGVWRTVDGRGHAHALRKSPFRQAQQAMFALRDSIHKHFRPYSPESRCPIGCAVVLPDVQELPPTPEFERSDVIYSQDLQPISASIRRLIRHRLRDHQPSCNPCNPEPEQVQTIRNFLRPEFYRVAAMSVRIERAEEKLLRLTEEQYDRLDELENNPRCLFEGAAGTGKTLLAVEFARRRARDGDRVLLVCFNRLLGGWLQGQLRGSSVTVGTWHDVLRQAICDSRAGQEFLGRERELAEGDAEAQRTLYGEVYPDFAETALLEREEPPFDVLVVDEAQDLLGPGKLPLLDLMIRGGLGGGRWSMFGDFTRQSLYNRNRSGGSDDPVADLATYGRQGSEGGSRGGLQFVKAGLKRNCRNTRNIAEHTAMIAGFETPPFRPGAESGIDVGYRYWGASSRWQDRLAETIEELTKKDKLPVGDIAILTPGRAEREALRKLERISGHPLVDGAPNQRTERPGIRVSTIHAFKGMESPIVIIPGLDRDLKDWDPSLLYVGMSRARSLLILIVHEKARDAVRSRIRMARQQAQKQLGS